MVINNIANRAYQFSHSLKLPTDIWQLWLVTLLYYVVLVFVNSNLSLALATCGYIMATALIRNSLSEALWLSLVATSILTKGKTYIITLIPKDQALNAVFDVNTIVPLYVADAILIALVLQLWRIKLWQRGNTNKHLRMPLVMLFLFLCNTIWLTWNHVYGEVILASVLQLIPLFFLLAIPSYLFSTKSQIVQLTTKKQSDLKTATYAMFLVVVLFQVGWSLAQYIQQAPFGTYIEGKLPGIEHGISTMEDHSLFRATGWFVDPALLGSFLFSALVGISVFYFRLKHPLQLLLTLFGIAVLFVSLTTTLNRILIFSSIVYCLIWWNSAKRQLSLKYVRLVPVLVLVGALVISPLIISRFSTITSSFQPYGSGWYRIEQALYVWRIFTVHPFGVGLGLSPLYFAASFPGEIPTFDPSYPHNIWLQLLAETGGSGMILYALFIFGVYRLWLTGNAKISPFGAAGLAYLYCAQFYPIFINQNELLKLCFIVFGCYLTEIVTQTKNIHE